MPAQYRSWLGQITSGKSIPQLKKFVDEGGTIITMGTSGTLAMHFGLPVTNQMVETVNGNRPSFRRTNTSFPAAS